MNARYLRDAIASRHTDPASVRFAADGATVTATIATSDLQADGIALDLNGGDYSRVTAGGVPLLMDHQNSARAVAGQVLGVRVEGDRLLADIAVTDADLRERIAAGTPINTSVGFDVVKQEGQRATAWTLKEVSAVGIGMDPRTGVGRNGGAEHTRTARLAQLATDFDAHDILAEALTSGSTPEQFEARIRERSHTRGDDPGRFPAIVRGVGDPEGDFSFRRLILDKLEGRSGPELERCAGQPGGGAGRTVGGKDIAGSIHVPETILRSLTVDRGRAAQARAENRRVLSTGTTNAPVDEVLLAEQYIDILRARLMLDRLGVRVLDDLTDDIAITKLTGTVTPSWLGESAAITVADQSFGKITMQPHECGAATVFSKKLLLQSSPSIEQIVRDDLGQGIARAIEAALFAGTGANDQPKGLVAQTAGDLALHKADTNGTEPTRADLVDLLFALEDANADSETAVWAMAPKVARLLRKTMALGGSSDEDAWLMDDMGMVLGRPTVRSTSIPHDITKGSAANTGPLYVADLSQSIVGYFGGLDVVVNPYSLDLQRQVRVVVFRDIDVQFRQLKAFAAISDVKHGA